MCPNERRHHGLLFIRQGERFKGSCVVLEFGDPVEFEEAPPLGGERKARNLRIKQAPFLVGYNRFPAEVDFQAI